MTAGALAEVRADLRADRRSRRRRTVVVNLALAAACLALVVVTFCFGSVRLSIDQVVASLLHLRENPAVDFIVRDLRLPQVEAAVGVGLALGAAGTIFQQLLRNPLASPDFVGISAGASLAAVIGIALPGVSGVGIPALALIGGLATAVLMYALAWRDGISGYRFILIGIGVSAFATGLTSYALTRTDLQGARAAMHWLVGSIGQGGDDEVRVLLVAVAVLLPASLVLQRMLRSLQLGDDTARALGAPAELIRLVLIVVAVVLTSLATAVAGPIAFVALVAGPVADRLLRTAAGSILAAGLVGTTVVLVADFIAVEVLPTDLPTGVVTGAIGAPYLLWLLATTNRRGLGG
ncbi:MAG TPA: iron chelate uptake ABC transporter family permease subunit [Nocardioides sp.]|uniref:FecCD family ABC transporter permease n=1 Tax=Nocardioides sp. TaxID=35761 RepID=UPI002BBBC050|nr:iron chelate uptake ABC transporter family permease subunit [Nocardioides sp.]HTW17615.1 iron chelate uptake ABC transporter family permease subunit [Nocardioides sp.]